MPSYSETWTFERGQQDGRRLMKAAVVEIIKKWINSATNGVESFHRKSMLKEIEAL